MTRSFALVLAVVGCLLFWSYLALLAWPASPVAAILCSLALGVMLTYAIVVALAERVIGRPLIRDPRAIEDEGHAALLAAFPPFQPEPGVCWHYSAACSPGCDCGVWHAGGAR